MAKLTDKQKKQIIAYYIECQNYSETGRKFNVSEGTIRHIIKQENNTDITKKYEQKGQENTEEVLEAMKKRSQTKIELVDKILKAMDGKLENIDKFTNIRDLATAYGIIIDKELKVKAGDVVEYTIKVTNTGSTTAKGIEVKEGLDVKVGEATEVTKAGELLVEKFELAPNASKEIKVYYTVTQNDVDTKSTIANSVTAKTEGGGRRTQGDREAGG